MAEVFISHRGADKVVATKLADELRDRGHTVWLDVWKINVGDSIVGKIDEGLSTASHLVMCYSEDTSTAPWMDREWMSYLAQQLNGASVRLLPARLTGGKPPAILADIQYADLVKDWQSGIDALDRALR
ncbi:toll/interleukin-1 receptor domain-containing protein [Streptomyces sp. NPDC003710]